MTYHMGCSRRWGIPHIVKPPNLSENSENSKDIVSSHAASGNGNGNGNASPTKISISSQYLLPGESAKRRRSRRGRIKDSYAKAIAAFSTIYPKVFSVRDRLCPFVKIEPRTPEEDTELLQELPALISPLKQVDHEVPVLLCKFRHDRDPRSCPQSEVPTWSSKVPSGNAEVPPPCESPGFDPLTEDSYVSSDECCDVESFLDSNNGLSDINRGMNGILGGAGDSNSVPDDHPSHACVFGAYGNRDLVDEGAYYSAIGALRRRQWHHDGCRRDDVALGHVAPWRMRLADKIKAEKEMNAMSFCLVDWLKRDDQHRLALKLNYEEVLRAWSDRGSLYIDGQCPQTVPDDDDDEDSVCHSMASVDLGLVPDLNFWRGGDDNVIQCNYTVEDGSSAVEDGVETKMNTGIREARVLRYKEKRQTRLFSKKIRYEVRKLNAERRPRMKGRFVKRLVDL